MSSSAEDSWKDERFMYCKKKHNVKVYRTMLMTKRWLTKQRGKKLIWRTQKELSQSCGLAVEHSAQDQKVVGSIPVQC